MRHRVRLAIALTVLTGLFCADRTALAAPQAQPEPGLAERLVTRLSDTLGRTVAAVRLVAQRRPGVVPNRPEPVRRPAAFASHPAVSPCQFPQPPPTA